MSHARHQSAGARLQHVSWGGQSKGWFWSPDAAWGGSTLVQLSPTQTSPSSRAGSPTWVRTAVMAALSSSSGLVSFRQTERSRPEADLMLLVSVRALKYVINGSEAISAVLWLDLERKWMKTPVLLRGTCCAEGSHVTCVSQWTPDRPRLP